MECSCEVGNETDPKCEVRGMCGKEHAHYIDIVFDGPPGPVTGRFVEVEDIMGRSVKFGEWVQRDDGYWALRIQQYPGAGFELRKLINAAPESLTPRQG